MTEPGLHLDAEAAADVATGLWRARRRLARAGGDRVLARHLDGLHDRLARAGLEVQDHDGLVVDAGTRLDVVAWEVRPELDRDVVVETVAPSVYCAGSQIRIGQVVVARPEDRGDDDGGAPDG